MLPEMTEALETKQQELDKIKAKLDHLILDFRIKGKISGQYVWGLAASEIEKIIHVDHQV